MKKVLIISALFIAAIGFAHAQNDSLKPVKGDWGFSLNITGLINDIKVESGKDLNGNYQIFARHYLKNDQALRLGLGLNYSKQSHFTSDSITISSGNTALEEIDTTTSHVDFSIALGLEKHLGNTKRLDPYVGGELLLGRIGNTKTNIDVSTMDVTGTAKRQIIEQKDGGMYVGIGGMAGFNFFFSKNLSLGAEFGYALTYVKSGGDFSVSDVTTPVSGSQINDFINGKDESSQTTVGATPTAGIMLSFFL